jgi:ACS family hexuronate transporter-like MFS transporter
MIPQNWLDRLLGASRIRTPFGGASNEQENMEKELTATGGLNYVTRPGGIGRYRWMICALLFFATTVNYMDRSVLAVLEPLLREKIGWDSVQYGNITSAFSAAYAVGLLFAGGLIDRLGTRIGYPLFMALWGMASISHAFVRTAVGFGIARVFLGLFEAGNFPAAVKTVAEWFPKKERSLAIGLFNSGSNVGAIAAPLIISVVVVQTGRLSHGRFDWQAAFCVTGVLEIIWIACWLKIYRRPEDQVQRMADRHVVGNSHISRLEADRAVAELAYVRSDPAEATTKIPWVKLFPFPQTWAFALAKLLTDPVWWFWLFWSSPYLHDKFGVDIKHIGLPLNIISRRARVGSLGGGWSASQFVKAGCSINMGRKLALLSCGLLVLPVMGAPFWNNEWGVVLLIGLAAAAHQGFSANLFALSGDLFPRRVVGSVVGIGGLMGGIGGIVVPLAAGHIIKSFHTYVPLFIFAGSAYIVAIGLIQLLSPRLEQARLDGDAVAVA